MDWEYGYSQHQYFKGTVHPDAQTVMPVSEALRQHIKRKHELRPGLTVHAEDGCDDMNAWGYGYCKPGLHLVVLLEGQLELAYGQQRIMLTTQTDRSGVRRYPHGAVDNVPQAFLIYLARPEKFSRRLRVDTCARRLSVSMSSAWLQPLAEPIHLGDVSVAVELQQLCARHMSFFYWKPSSRALALVEQMLQPPSGSRVLQTLYQESRVLEILSEVLRTLPSSNGLQVSEEQLEECVPPSHSTLDARTWRRMRSLRAFLSGEGAWFQTLDEISRHIGMHSSTMQRQFRAAFNMSIGDFIRENRLQRARLALESQSVSIKEAAIMAGYTSAANFATAYRRRFGLTPKQARQCDKK